MLRQYHPGGRTAGRRVHGRPVGVINVGEVYYPQDRVDRFAGPVYRQPWIVTGFRPATKDHRALGAPIQAAIAWRGPGAALCRSLRTGKVLAIAMHTLITASDQGHERYYRSGHGSFAAYAATERAITGTVPVRPPPMPHPQGKGYVPAVPRERPDPRPGPYYVSVVDGGRVGLLAGPFADHADAIAMVEPARQAAERVDPWATFYAVGTVRMAPGFVAPGRLNDRLGIAAA